MRKSLLAVIFIAAIGVGAAPAHAQERAVTGAAIGAGAGLLVLGPIGAVAGGAMGAYVGGPRLRRVGAKKVCRTDRDGVRRCRWR